jgi:hypothetical protein
MAEKKLKSDLYVARKTFLVEGNLWVRQGDTAVAGHPILKGRVKDGTFVPFVPTFGEPEPEPAPAPEPEPAPEPATASEPEPTPAAENDEGAT